MVSYFSYIEHIMKRLHKKFHDFITLLKISFGIHKFQSKTEKGKRKIM